jgi:predicted nucleic acid-binding protein
MTLLLDASVWVAASGPDERFHGAAEEVVESAELLGALDLTLFEVANAIGFKRNEQRRATRLCGAIVARCRDRFVRVDPGLIDIGLEVVAEHGLTAYDAAYVAAARHRGWTLVSTDIGDLVSKGLAVAPDAAV